MTREEAIEELKLLKEDYWDDDGYGHETKQYGDTMLALDMAIKALEQESILDKIRSEVELHRRKTKSIDPYDLVGDCLEIIDEYKSESEVKEMSKLEQTNLLIDYELKESHVSLNVKNIMLLADIAKSLAMIVDKLCEDRK